jgi:hypothetical protein
MNNSAHKTLYTEGQDYFITIYIHQSGSFYFLINRNNSFRPSYPTRKRSQFLTPLKSMTSSFKSKGKDYSYLRPRHVMTYKYIHRNIAPLIADLGTV